MKFPHGEGFRRPASEHIIEKLSLQSVQQGAAWIALGLSGAFAGHALFLENGQPSKDERKEIVACAGRLTDKTVTISEFSFPEECSRFRGSFEQEEEHGVTDYTMPSEDRFLDQHLLTNTIEEDRDNQFDQAFIFLGLGLALHGVVAFRRRLQEVDVAYEAESYLRMRSEQK